MAAQSAVTKTPEGAGQQETVTRRHLFHAGVVGVAGAVLAMLGGIGDFLFPKVLFEPPRIFLAGRPEDYPPGTVATELKERRGVWIVSTSEGLYALISICTHLGCSPNWFEDEGLFKCPCHGSNYNLDGDVVAGPAPESLFRASVKVNPFGQLVVDKSLQVNGTDERKSAKFFLRHVA